MDSIVFSGGLEDNHRFVFSDFLLDRGMAWQAEAVQKTTWAETFGLDEYGVYAQNTHAGKMRLVPFRKRDPFWIATERIPQLPWDFPWKVVPPKPHSKPSLEDFLPTIDEWKHSCIFTDLGILQHAEVWEMTKSFDPGTSTRRMRWLIKASSPFDEHPVSDVVMGYIRVKIPVI